MKKLCFVTATRAEYGLLKWLMREVQKSACFEFQLLVTGAHLMQEQGHTIDQIVEDGFRIDAVVDVQPDTSSMETIAASMGRLAELSAPAFDRLKPDYLVVLGDRYELLPICNTAFIMHIPIIHLSGGDVTIGALDNGIRNAVTMLAEYHFPGTKDSADNIVRMKGSGQNVWVVGEPGLDSFYKEELLTRNDLASALGLDKNRKWILLTYHAETKEELAYNLNAVKNCIRVLKELPEYQVIATYANTDFGGKHINNYLEETKEGWKNGMIVIPSLGNLRYLSVMRQVALVMGNSSSGIVEAPALGIPVVNIGDRQKGRHLCSNIRQADTSYDSIKRAVHETLVNKTDISDVDYWGDGRTSERIMEILEKVVRDE